jgi:hypothetical protein
MINDLLIASFVMKSSNEEINDELTKFKEALNKLKNSQNNPTELDIYKFEGQNTSGKRAPKKEEAKKEDINKIIKERKIEKMLHLEKDKDEIENLFDTSDYNLDIEEIELKKKNKKKK